MVESTSKFTTLLEHGATCSSLYDDSLLQSSFVPFTHALVEGAGPM